MSRVEKIEGQIKELSPEQLTDRRKQPGQVAHKR
jgi:hypothetical protein